MSHSKAKTRAKRLISSECYSEDLTNLFLFMRECAGCSPIIKDIGHFVAHPEKRDEGITVDYTSVWVANVAFHLNNTLGKALDLKRLPPVAPTYLRCAADHIGRKNIYRSTRISFVNAKAILSNLASTLTENVDGTWAVSDNITIEEFRLVKYVTSVLVSKPAFTPEALYKDFISVLNRNNLVSKDELSAHAKKLKPLVLLFTISTMHNAFIKIDEKLTVQLKAGAVKNGIVVMAVIPDPQRPTVGYANEMFLADLSPETYCHPNLLSREWFMDVEVGRDGRIIPLI